ncbi:MAG: hypothetical protein OWR52_06600 [Acidibacillus sp.]|uniref:Uncharacterized protein n=1 Tax=Sulfoacidibacillus ferrooxidans TaxID=2005001 RepID=A0A9X2AEA2_9BACL|nr:hypothetical protein [Sulfoacidibacillus ferrooxidans]MCI0183132.1 hypothetical protein [Sulfoacidibacillus ferrooxidans]MCY0893159.1 hypothetical protein [Acidibacillus sp.]
MEVLAILTFLTVVFLFIRARYLASPLHEFEPTSTREHLLEAGDILQNKGYRIIGERIAHELSSFFGNRKFITYIIVDFLVEKEGIQYPIKVRSPRDSTRISGAMLRKQLFALYTLYETPVGYLSPDTGVLEFVDFTIDFPGRYYAKRWRMRLLWMAIGLSIGWLLSFSH